MLTEEEMLKIQQLSEQNPDVDFIIKRLNEESKFMISRISHEIRNPLTLISSTLQLMESKNPELLKMKYWPQMRSDVNDVILLLNDLSTFNSSDKLTISHVNLSCMIHDIADSFESTSYESNIKFSICIHESAISYIQSYPCDKIKLKQVLTNIIRNAFEAMDDGDSLAISVKLDQREDNSSSNSNNKNKNLMIIISNNGNPIPPEYMDTLFEPFITHKNSGTGLGLAISNKIIKSHGGSISVKSSEELTSFIITLPIQEK
jgi:signal transduction histidine kinase